ncbi:metallophosphoesterase [Deinococcus sonorensis]|uniref:Metallophosphoesterase n=2 Tax=Deinococcus sonorensis TaxID=309891 RepID=A0AAU7UCN0_9DEIO
MREVVVIPDLHGRLDLLQAAVQNFAGAHFLSLGDAIDRGPRSMETVDALLRLHAEGRATLLMGNHERMALEGLRWYRRYQETQDLSDYRRAMQGYAWWMQNGGETVRREVRGGVTLEHFPERLAQYLDLLRRIVYVTADGAIHDQRPAEPSVLVAHASPPVRHKDHEDPEEAALWLRPYEGPFPLPEGVVYSVHGHTPVRVPLRVGRHVYLDLGAHATGRLALLPLTVQTLSVVTVLVGPGDPGQAARYPVIGEPVSARSVRVEPQSYRR